MRSCPTLPVVTVPSEETNVILPHCEEIRLRRSIRGHKCNANRALLPQVGQHRVAEIVEIVLSASCGNTTPLRVLQMHGIVGRSAARNYRTTAVGAGPALIPILRTSACPFVSGFLERQGGDFLRAHT